MALQKKKPGFWRSLKPAFIEMKQNDPLRMAGATAFFTTFALPPILIILFQVFTLFLSGKVVSSEIMELLSNTFGAEGARQIRVTTRGFRTIARNWYIAAAGFLFLVFVATTLFTVIKNTLNDIWNVKVKENPGFLFYLKLRAKSLLVILLAGLLFVANLFLTGFKLLATKYPESGGGRFFSGIANQAIVVIVVTIWFILLFRFLADARPSWKVAITGGCLTGVLFSGGKALLSFLMRNSNVKTIYGASGSMVLLLLFVFYCSFILYYGASFIKVYSESLRHPLTPVSDAYLYQLKEISS